MRRPITVFLLVLGFTTVGTGVASAQGGGAGAGGGQGGVEGPVDLGTAGDQGAGFGAQGGLISGTAAGAGQITGSERYYRRPVVNREFGEFVGADRADISSGYGNPRSIALYGGTGLVVGNGGGGGARGINQLGAGGNQGVSFGGQGAQTGRGVGGQATTNFGGGLNNALGGLAGLGGQGGLGNQRLGGQAGLQGGTGQQGAFGTANQAQPVRAAMVIGFAVPAMPSRSAPQLSIQLARRFSQVPQIQARSPVQVEMTGRTVVLRGSVTTAHGRDLAERLALLEPGVERVVNELAIEPAGN